MSKLYTGWNYVYGESWEEYIKRRTVTRDLVSAQREAAREIVAGISKSTAEALLGKDRERSLIRVLEPDAILPKQSYPQEIHSDQLDQLTQTFLSGMGNLSHGLGEIADGINNLESTFQWGFGEVFAQLGGIQDSLNELLKSVKRVKKNAAYEHFSDARVAFKRHLYGDCLELLDKAINGDHVSSGYKLEWRFHLLRGIVLLGSRNIPVRYINLEEAKQSFIYARIYAERINKPEAAKASMQAGWAAFVQGELVQAEYHAKKATELNPSLAEAWYLLMKIAAAQDNILEWMSSMHHAFELDFANIVKADADFDFRDYRIFVAAMARIIRSRILDRVLAGPHPIDHNVPGSPTKKELKEDYGLFPLLAYEKESPVKIKQHEAAQLKKRQAEEAERERVKKELERAKRELERMRAAAIEEERVEKERKDKEKYFVELQMKLDTVRNEPEKVLGVFSNLAYVEARYGLEIYLKQPIPESWKREALYLEAFNFCWPPPPNFNWSD